MSAASSSSPAVAPLSGNVATPTLIVIAPASTSGNALDSTDCLTRSASTHAPSRAVWGRITTNSSPPYFATRSIDPVHRDENSERRVTHLEGRRQAGRGAQPGQRVGLRAVPRIRSHVRHVERLAFQHDPAGDAVLALDVVSLELVELAVVGDPARILPDLPALDGDEEYRLGVQNVESAVRGGLEDRLLCPAPVHQAGDCLKGGKEQLVRRQVGGCRMQDFVVALHGAQEG